MEVITSIMGFLKPLIEAYAGNYGAAIQVVAIVGTLRLVIKPIMAGIAQAVKDTESKKDDEILSKIEGNVFYKAFFFLLDLIASLKLKPKAKA